MIGIRTPATSGTANFPIEIYPLGIRAILVLESWRIVAATWIMMTELRLVAAKEKCSVNIVAIFGEAESYVPGCAVATKGFKLRC